MFVVAVVLISGVPTDFRDQADRESGLGGEVSQRKGLSGQEIWLRSQEVGQEQKAVPVYPRPPISHILDVAVAHIYIGPLENRESRSEVCRVDIADVERTRSRNVPSISEIVDAAQRVQMQL